MTPYKKGYRFERRVKKFLESQGYLVFRPGKSSFPDLIVIQPRTAIISLVECKVNKYLKKEEKERAREFRKLGLAFKVAYREGRKIKFWSGNYERE